MTPHIIDISFPHYSPPSSPIFPSELEGSISVVGEGESYGVDGKKKKKKISNNHIDGKKKKRKFLLFDIFFFFFFLPKRFTLSPLQPPKSSPSNHRNRAF